jgi:hypothetical protein
VDKSNSSKEKVQEFADEYFSPLLNVVIAEPPKLPEKVTVTINWEGVIAGTYSIILIKEKIERYERDYVVAQFDHLVQNMARDIFTQF